LPASNAEIVGIAGSAFTITVDSGTVAQAKLNGVLLTVDAGGQSIAVPSLPVGDSTLWVAIVFAPGDPAANIGVGVVSSGQAVAAVPPGTLDSTEATGTVVLFGAAAA
jgi:hypothetical protein